MIIFRTLGITLAFLFLSAPAQATGDFLDKQGGLHFGDSLRIEPATLTGLVQEDTPAHSAPLQLAASSLETNAMAKGNAEAGHEEMKIRWFTRNKLHQYLGLGSIGSATIAVLSPKEEGGAHEQFAEGAMGLGALAVLTGLGFHYDDLSIRNGLSNTDNWHALLGTLGTLGFAAAVDEAPESGHAGPGVTGYLSMMAAIKLTW